MKDTLHNHMRTTRRGQTLIIALIVLFVLMILGFVFLGIINRNILQANRSQQRSLAGDLAQAGVRYAHAQLLNSELGADWRPTATALLNATGNNTIDPDAYYLRPRDTNTSLSLRGTLPDYGGPDGLGAFARVKFTNGRALIRVRYAPSDVDFLQDTSSGPLRNPGKAHNYIIIESIGRPGALNENDPTTTLNAGTVQYKGFASQASFLSGINALSTRDNSFAESRKLIAFASIGLLDSARFITNINHVSRTAEIGSPLQLGVTAFDDTPAVGDNLSHEVHVPQIFGGSTVGVGNVPIFGNGSIYSNADLKIHGTVEALVNVALGEGIFCAGKFVTEGSIDPANAGDAKLVLDVYNRGGAKTTYNLNQAALQTGDTHSGAIRDGVAGTDASGNPRGIPYKTPPNILQVDPATGFNRFVSMSRDSGDIEGGGNSGLYGHGRNVYVNNGADIQTQRDENGRQIAGSSEALFHDWLNPNTGQPNSGWQGPYYVPVGAYLQLEPDGFIITRDSRAPADQRTWKTPAGTDSGLTSLQFKISPFDRLQPNAPRYIINTLTPGVNINAASPAYNLGQPFDGVVFFEGNVRVRGMIPTDTQLTVVSLGNIYIDGSITKGVIDRTGALINTASSSALALLAKDYVAVNTTQFFGPETHRIVEKSSSQNPNALNPIVLSTANGAIDLITEFLLDSENNPGSAPTGWTAYAREYRQWNDPSSNTGAAIDTRMLLTHTMDDGPAPFSDLSLNINYGLSSSNYNYYFPQPAGGNDVIYQMGGENWQRYARFESKGFPLVQIGASGQTTQPPQITSTSAQGSYGLNVGLPSSFTFFPNNRGFDPTNDYLLARSAIVPQDVRIEAMLYAQEGSFFVIPGPWFNPNPNDRRDQYGNLPGTNDTEKNEARLQDYGNSPEVPFYGEPLDVRIVVYGAINENMPPPMSQQAEWLKKWGWIPREHGKSAAVNAGTGATIAELIPWVHVPRNAGYDLTTRPTPSGGQTVDDALSKYLYVPNLIVQYDPMLATGRVGGYNPSNPAVRAADDAGLSTLPPMPRLPVSPVLSYFGEVSP
jgi:hypothetical protein